MSLFQKSVLKKQLQSLDNVNVKADWQCLFFPRFDENE